MRRSASPPTAAGGASAMEVTSHDFKAKAKKGIGDPDLQQAMRMMATGFPGRRREAVERLPEFDQLRDVARDIKNHVLENLDHYLERFEAKVIERGGKVHWCQTPRQARETILAICQSVQAKTCTKGKSMIAEEIGLNPFLSENGIEPIETDLGEYIIQLADEP